MKCCKSLHGRYPFKNIKTKIRHYCSIDIYKKCSIHNDIKYIIRQTMSTNKIQYLATSLKIYKGFKHIIIKKYPKLRIVNGKIGYIKNISLTNVKWIQKDIMMHPPINILVNFNNFIKNMLVDKTRDLENL